jgi:putative NIF3 family GTP cyclohydrolase 1 type 2
LEAAVVTAEQIVARIQKTLLEKGITWRAQTVDTFKAGAPATEVKGIATTGMATFDVLRRAAAAGRNFVITHEPTFYGHTDETTGLRGDPTYEAKQRFISDHHLVIFRFHDHAHALRPDPLVAGSARMLGWTQYASPSEPRIYVLPPTTLGALATEVARRVKGRAIRVAGDPTMPVTRIALGPGYGVPALTSSFDVAVGGEAAEAGGNAEYLLDAAAIGQKKGLILLGHMMSEDFGMKEVAEWLQGFVSDVPVEWIPAGEPFS